MTLPSRSSRATFHMLICSSVGSLENKTNDCGVKSRLCVDAIAYVTTVWSYGKGRKGTGGECGGVVVFITGDDR